MKGILKQMELKVPDKLFFSIGEVSRITGIQPYVLRYWESEFKALRPQKNRGGQRSYRRGDLETILRIKSLLYDEHYTIRGARRCLREMEREEKGPSREELLSLIKILKEGLKSIKEMLK